MMNVTPKQTNKKKNTKKYKKKNDCNPGILKFLGSQKYWDAAFDTRKRKECYAR